MKRSVLGMLSVAAGVSIFSVQDVIVKGLSATFPVHEIVVLRSVVASPVLLVLTLQNGTGRVAPTRLGLHAARGLSLFVAYFSYYLAMAAMPIADVVAICFAAPLIITALSGPVLGERVKPQSWAAIAIGFAAVLIIVRPDVATSEPSGESTEGTAIGTGRRQEDTDPGRSLHHTRCDLDQTKAHRGELCIRQLRAMGYGAAHGGAAQPAATHYVCR